MAEPDPDVTPDPTPNPDVSSDTPWQSSYFKEDGSIDPESYSKMPEELRGLGQGELKNVTDLEGLIRKVDGLKGVVGKKGLGPLAADASDEDKVSHQALVSAANGAPEKADGYNFTRPEDLPEGAWSDENAAAATAILHKYGASPAMATELLAMQVASVQAQMQAQTDYETQFFEAQENEFREALTTSGDDYDKVMDVVNNAAAAMGIDAENPLLKNATVRNLLHELAKNSSEDKFKGGSDTNGGTKSAEAQAADIVHNKENPLYEAYWDGTHANNKAVKAQVMALLESASKVDAANNKR